jgi:hypothetical protein
MQNSVLYDHMDELLDIVNRSQTSP